jgi:hypothetical protein
MPCHSCAVEICSPAPALTPCPKRGWKSAGHDNQGTSPFGCFLLLRLGFSLRNLTASAALNFRLVLNSLGTCGTSRRPVVATPSVQ